MSDRLRIFYPLKDSEWTNIFLSLGQPGKPDVADWGENFAELKWKAPESDGGAEIQEYRVEVRNRDKRAWLVGGHSRECNLRVNEHISAGNEYEFRVVAINKGGDSENSPTSKSVLAKNRFVKPKINKDVLAVERTVHAGQTLKIELEIRAEPVPSVNWTFPDGKEAKDDGRAGLEIDDLGVATFTLKEVSRADAGNFNVIVKNSEGHDEVEVRVNVLDAPQKPLGPLEVSCVTPHSCKLSWKKPADDGGSQITGYNIERKELDRDVWISCGKLTGKTVLVMKFLDFDVNDLLQYGVYMFRVMAVNAQGEGEPLLSTIPCIAKHAVDPPLQPATPRVTDWDRKWAKLEWWAPSESDIKHYVIEKREIFLVPKDAEAEEEKQEEAPEETPEEAAQASAVQAVIGQAGPKPTAFTGEFQEYNSGWMVAMMTEDATPEVKLTDLSEGNRYQFRIKAVNGAGASEPSEETEEIVCKIRKQRPSILRDTLKPVCVSAGQTIVLSAKCIGEPVPAKAFFYGRIEIKPCGSVDVAEKEHSIKVTMLGARRDDTGVYTLRVENEHGSDSADVDVVVMDLPGKPHGPLKISDVYGQGCTVEWSPPEDDGGTPITHYLLEKLEGAQTQWVSCGKTNGDCFKCHVQGLTCGKEYRIQVSAVNAEGISEPLGGVDSFITENPFGTPGAPGKPEAVGVDSDHFDMKWQPPKNDGGSTITGYQLEARLWKDNVYFSAGEIRYNLEFGEASGIELDQAYAVRVRAINAAGPGPWSLDSDQCVCRHKSLKPKVVIKAEKEVTFKAGESLVFWADVKGEPACEDIQWMLNGKELVEGPGNGIFVDNSKPYKSMVQKDNVSRKDCGLLVCNASNMNGKASAQIKINVVDKPSMPEDRLLVSNIHRSGCRLTWQPSKDDGGLPIEYVVEKYVAAADAWSKCAQISGTSIEISDLENGREYAFSVRAVNSEGESDALPTSRTMTAKDAFSKL